jgi:hypothetical protein
MNMIQVLVIIALVGWMLLRRIMGQPLRQRRLVLLPLLMLAWGASGLLDAHLSSADVGLLAGQLVIAVGIGAVRGATIDVFVRDGVLWMRYRWTTIALWVVSALIRVGLIAGASALGSGLDGGGTLMIGVAASLLGESMIIASRGHATGAPFAPARASRRGGTRLGRRAEAEVR